MKKYFLYALMLCAFISCKDNSGLYGLLADMDNRIAEVEQQCEQINTNIDALEALVEAQQTGDYITAIIPIKEGDIEIGYTITFAKHDPITIYHGKNGKDGKDGQDGQNGTNGTNGQDGHSPVIGVAQETDGVYYWTLDGEWMLDGNGQKIRVTGQDGQDGQDGTNGTNGITPQLKIEADYWYISYDGGTTWTQLGQAKGDKGDKGDSMFQSVTQDDNFVYFTLTGGTVITIAKNGSSDFNQTVIDNLVNSITLNKSTIYMTVGDTAILHSTTSPFETSKVTWSSLYNDVVSVNNGELTALHGGVSRITAKAGDKSTTCLVYVKEAAPLNTGFSVSSTKRVTFALGNLYVQEDAYYIGTAFEPNGDIFFWGETNADNAKTQTQYTYDWGIHPIVNAGNVANEWRTLDTTEWKYVISERPNADLLKYKDNNAWYIFPDNLTLESIAYYKVERCISTTIWKNLLQYCEVVRIPAIGRESAKPGSISTINGCYYWTCKAKARSGISPYPTTGGCINIETGQIEWPFVDGYILRAAKCPVRLVKDVE